MAAAQQGVMRRTAHARTQVRARSCSVAWQAAYYEKGIAFFIGHKAEQTVHMLPKEAVAAAVAAEAADSIGPLGKRCREATDDR